MVCVYVVDDEYPHEQPDCFSAHETAQPMIPSVTSDDTTTITKKGRTFDEIREENRRKKQKSKMQSQSSSSMAKEDKESVTMKGLQNLKIIHI